MMLDAPRNHSHPEIDHFIDKVFYCGINSGISIIGILGNVLLLIIFIHPGLIPHKTLFHSYLKVKLILNSGYQYAHRSIWAFENTATGSVTSKVFPTLHLTLKDQDLLGL